MDVKEFLQNDRFAAMLGIELLEASDGKATAKLEIKEEHLNTIDIAHGGAIFSLSDFTFATAPVFRTFQKSPLNPLVLLD